MDCESLFNLRLKLYMRLVTTGSLTMGHSLGMCHAASSHQAARTCMDWTVQSLVSISAFPLLVRVILCLRLSMS